MVETNQWNPSCRVGPSLFLVPSTVDEHDHRNDQYRPHDMEWDYGEDSANDLFAEKESILLDVAEFDVFKSFIDGKVFQSEGDLCYVVVDFDVACIEDAWCKSDQRIGSKNPASQMYGTS
mmetsp:Transcript_12098/g.18443  ORF Transcript_12098/g.18443 Transcript_12098/m.18443 type:complete len:120 (+) Transcript_12098:168-527(+)